MIEGPDQKIQIHLESFEATEIRVDGEPTAAPKGVILLSKKRDTHFVSFQRTGYESTTVAFNRSINPFWPVADLIWGPAFPIAWFVDWYTGSLHRIDPRDLHVILRKENDLAN